MPNERGIPRLLPVGTKHRYVDLVPSGPASDSLKVGEKNLRYQCSGEKSIEESLYSAPTHAPLFPIPLDGATHIHDLKHCHDLPIE